MLRWWVGVCGHWCPRRGGDGLVVHAGLGVHALHRHDVAEAGIRARLKHLRLVGMWPGEVGDEVKVLALRSRDTERLLHESIRLVSVAVRLAIVGSIVTAAT